MCGICGIIHDDIDRPVERRILEAMNRTMIHRGPDDEGYFIGHGSGLAMRRLSIIDVGGGHQPLFSEDGHIAAICNGELYNFQEIRSDLKSRGHLFRTRSDTEILPHLFEEKGIETPSAINGMFGMAVWDEPDRTLLLARDRMGEKPLYWTHQGGKLIFGSELKAILAHPDIRARIDHSSLSKYLAYEFIPAPHTIIENVHKLEPGQMLIYKAGRIDVRLYWDIPIARDNISISDDEASRELLRLLELSVKRRLVSDVPLGVFLSGGIDSSSVVAMMSRLKAPNDIKTFSISFTEKSFDESSHAKKVAAHFGTDHREQVCTPPDLLKLLPQVVNFLDEPFADPSIIPTFALSKFTRSHVTVALGGDGGDELFAGYPTFQAEKYARIYNALPGFLRRGFIEPIVKRFPVSDENISFDFKLKQFLKGARVVDPSRHFIWIGSFSPEEQEGLLDYKTPVGLFADVSRHAWTAQMASPGNRLLYIYKKLYLAEDILTKIDRASMGTALETRAPFLDHELVEFVASLPYCMKLRRTTMKYLLKKAMGPILPSGIANRSKKGFGIPVAKWVKGPLKELMLDHLNADRIKREGFFRTGFVSQMIKEHLAGQVDHHKRLWTLLMFEQWLERWGR